MFLQFIAPIDVRNEPYTYEWVFYRAVHKLKDLGLLMPPLYWHDVEARKEIGAWPTQHSAEGFFRYKTPSALDISQLGKFPLGHHALDEVSQTLVGPGLIWAHSITARVPSLEAEIIAALDAAGPVEAIFLWNNCASLKAVARERGIPTIHHELGPLRDPYFRFTAYFDFEGVNGQTEADVRWRSFQSEDANVPILSRSELLRLFSINRPAPADAITHGVGIALQVPDDSNILAFGNGFNSYELISSSLRYLPGSTLVRPHPGRPQYFSSLPVDWDESEHPWEFFNRVESVLTINSSMAFEAMLLGKPTYVLGDSPFRSASWDIRSQSPQLTEDEMIRWLNWFIFGYLIPFEMTFDSDYSRWRLSGPSESEIYIRNYNSWTQAEQPAEKNATTAFES